MTFRTTEPLPADTAELHTLFRLSITDAFRQEGIDRCCPDDLKREISNQEMVLRQYLTGQAGRIGRFLIARGGGKILGTIACGDANEAIKAYLKADFLATPEIKCLYILPDFQGRGIGTALFAAMVNILKQAGVESFCLDCGYQRAQRFWIRTLGEPTVVLADHFARGAHFMIWQRSVAGPAQAD